MPDAASTASSELARRQIDALRKKLLDLSLRNRMLNYRASKRYGIEVFGEDSASLYKILVEDSKRMSFVGKPDPLGTRIPSRQFDDGDEVSLAEYRRDAEEEMDAFLENAAMPIDQLDTKLNTKELESVLQPKLRTVLREARIANEELGINTLFLTLGMLEWQDDAQRTCRAPLLFLPVDLQPQANGGVRLIHAGSDVGTNLPLAAKLNEFNIKLPNWDDDKGMLTYLSEIESTINGFQKWKVNRDEVHLDFFNYEKYAMYVDLGGETWAEGQKPWDNADIQAIFATGYSAGESRVNEETHLDTVRTITDSHEIFDADGSQTIALIRAAEGFSMVVEGPPGTGKSQTIANIIAEGVASGKTILFVSAKRAALDVVKRRLTDADLGPMCLDMHDKLTNRREFYAELKRTVDRNVVLKSDEERVLRLGQLRARLNQHCEAVNEVLNPFCCTPFEAMCELARLPTEQPEDRGGRVDFEQIRNLNAQQVRRAVPLLRALQVGLVSVGVPANHPFWGAQIDYLDRAINLDLSEELDAAIIAIDQARTDWGIASEALKIDVSPCYSNARVLQECAQRAVDAPPVDGVSVKSQSWHLECESVRTVIAALRVRQQQRITLAGLVTDQAWTTDLTAIHTAFQRNASNWYRFLFSDFRSANQSLQILLSTAAPQDPVERLAILDSIKRAQIADAEITLATATMQRLFGAQWRGFDSNPEVLETVLAWVLDLQSGVENGLVPTGFLDFFMGNHSDPQLNELVGKAERACKKALDAYQSVTKILTYPDSSPAATDLNLLRNQIVGWRTSLPGLPTYVAFSEARRQVVNANLAAVVEVADRWELAVTRLESGFLRCYFNGVVRQSMQSRPELKTFERVGHESAIGEFRALDDFKLLYNRAQVRLAHQRSLPTFNHASGKLQYLKVQCELQRRHKPIRWAMLQAGEAVQKIKPVFLMSPLSVAIHLPPEMPIFDMVIFDEASQIKPEDALCAIARAKQCIVVGDTRQMPPSSFFDRVVEDDADDEEDTNEFGTEARKLESILSLMSAVVQGSVRRPDLRWHYRSVHPALIQPSNEMFYDNRLLVFPSPGDVLAGREIGLILKHHPETVYEAGAKRRVNRAEAELIADRVVEILRTSPEESLLVATMNKSQADLIYDEVTKRERTEPALFARYRQRHPHEPLDVKNLETVQGDERDVVIVSVTYGRDASGNIRQHFGPLLRDGGERRLNVLFTRSRLRCEVFSNLSADDIRAEGLGQGVVALKRYLTFAESGHTNVSIPTAQTEESPFEEEVGDALRGQGYEVHCQIGCEGFRIDLAVVDPAKQGRYILGVECDGATYHSARSARDRDKLRQRVLEVRGWNIHRIWSHDWWQDQEGEIHRLVSAITALSKNSTIAQEIDPVEVEIVPKFEEQNHPRVAEPISRPYVATNPPEGSLLEAGLADYVSLVAYTEGPIHRDLLFVRVRNAAGYLSARGSTRSGLDRIIDEKLGSLKQLGDAIYGQDSQLYLPRDWSERPPQEKKIELVTEVEIAAAIRNVVRQSFGIAELEVTSAAVRILGFRNSTVAVQRISGVLTKMIDGRALVREKNGTLRVNTPAS